MESDIGCHCLDETDDKELYDRKEFITRILLVAQTCRQQLKEPIFEDQDKRDVEIAAATLKLYRQRANVAKLVGSAAGIAGNGMVIGWKISSGSPTLLSFGIALIVIGVAATIAADFCFQFYKWKVVQSVKDPVETFIEACLFLEAEERFYTTLFQKQQETEDLNKNEKVESADYLELRKSLQDLQKGADDMKMSQQEYQMLGHFFISLCDFVSQTYSEYNEVWCKSQKSETASESVITLFNQLKKEKNIILNIFIVINEMGAPLTLTVLSSTDYVQGDPETNQVISSLQRSYVKAALRRKAWNFLWKFLSVFNLLVNVATLVAVTYDLARKSPEEVADLFFKISTGMSQLSGTDKEKRKALVSLLLELGPPNLSACP